MPFDVRITTLRGEGATGFIKQPHLSVDDRWGSIIEHRFITLHTVTPEKSVCNGRRSQTTRFLHFWGNGAPASGRREGRGGRVPFSRPNERSDLHKVTFLHHHRTCSHFLFPPPFLSTFFFFSCHVLHTSSAGPASWSPHAPTPRELERALIKANV